MTGDRAVSVAITHALTIAITAVLLSALLISAGNLLQSQERRVAESQFTDIGADIASQVNSLDRLNATGSNVTASVTPDYPAQVAGESWQVSFSDGAENPFGTEYALNISSPVYSRTVQIPLNTTHTRIDPDASARGAETRISLCRYGNITLGECP